MSHSQSHDGKLLDNYTLSVVERRADRTSWNETIAGTIGKAGTVAIGRHYLIPDAFLPYRNESAPQGVLPALDAPLSPEIRTIATTHSAFSYAIAFAGEDRLDGCGDAVHLALRPLHDAERYNVRDMWVRPSDFRLCKAIFASRLFQPAGKGKPYPTMDTVELDENGLISSYSLFVQMHFLIGTYAVTDAGAFSNLAWAQEEPASLFERK